ncbi:MAG: nickel-dependent lactate racemase [Planctomycetaceae bacterium]|jgi:nickel-dependent lactate racemase|nr:nickel-dependent lactate racemase [Planctomycetaceae bacterium]
MIRFPYGRDFLEYDFHKSNLRFMGVLESALHTYVPPHSQDELIRNAISNPIGTPPLSELVRGKRNIVLIASDHTRPVPSKLIMPQLLAEIRCENPNAEITILIAPGCHRRTTDDEIIEKFGQKFFETENIIVHDCDNSEFVNLGKLPSGGDLVLNKIAIDADLLIAEGFIEPHFFAGFSGGRKSILPGIASRETVIYNHNARFIADDHTRTGILQQNPIHTDMIFAARKAKLAFICNVVINSQKEVIHAVAGDCEQAHVAGCEFLCKYCMLDAIPADIVITSNGGYPLDQNIYQAVKCMAAAEAAVKKNGVIIAIAKSNDGHGSYHFHKTFADEKNLDNLLKKFMETPNSKTLVDQWQSQIFARVLKHATVIYISDAPEQIVRELHLIPAKSIAEAITEAVKILNNPNATITAIPDGVSVIINTQNKT